MEITTELFLNKKNIHKEEWIDLINIISNYNGILRKWKIIVSNEKNKIRYFIKTSCSLPATINNLNVFLLKRVKDIKISKPDYTFISIKKNVNNIIELINLIEIKNKGKLKYLEIEFIKIYNKKIMYKISYYVLKNGKIIKYISLFLIPSIILQVNYEKNNRYFCKSSPKYLEINKIFHLINNDNNNALLNIDTFPYLQGKYYLNQNNFSFDKHSIIIGSSGSGKSKFISLLINGINKNNILKQKYKFVVIDPHASLENDVGGIGRVIDFNNKIDCIDLFVNNADDTVSSTELLLDLFKSLLKDQYNSKIERVLRHSIYLLLTDESLNFKNLRKIILDLECRNNIIKKVKNKLPISVIDFFLQDFNELKTKSYGEAISPIIGFIDEMEMIPAFNMEQNTENLKDTIHYNFLTLFSLNRTKLGDKVTKTISGLIMQQLLTIVQQKEIKEHIIFIIDEVAVIENPILSRYLSESRKYNLSLILTGQYFNQISNELKNSIFANVCNYFIFRVSKIDAISLVDMINMKIPLDDSRERKIKLLTELNNRECIARIDSNGVLMPAFKGITLDYKSIPRIKKEVKEKEQNKKYNSNNKEVNFNLNSNISLKDILISNSTSRKVVEK